tara:strand:+ start:6554 stop:7744 length:1191 start_codon:yes stop_codon:yes gene_type:complete
MSEYIDNDNMCQDSDNTNIIKFEDWDSMNLKEDILRGIYTNGFEKPSYIQSQSIPVIIEGKDVIAQAQSGMGKTGAFSISTLQTIDVSENKTQALLISPTHELAKQTYTVLTTLGSYINGLNIKLLIGGTSIKEDISSMQKTPPHIVVGCSGRVYDMIRRKSLRTQYLKLFILDEADEMLSKGFKDQIYDIFQYMPKEIQSVIISATLPVEVLNITDKFMKDPTRILMKVEKLNLECITQYYVAIHDDYMKYDVLKDLYSSISVSQSIIYCNSVNRVMNLYDAMNEQGFSVCCIHSSMDKMTREAEFKKFRDGNYRVLISSDITSRGIDIQHVSTVINFDIPKSPYTYLHRIGRSGRWGRKGMAINLITRKDLNIMRKLETFYKINILELPQNFQS